MTQKKNRGSNVQAAKANGPSAAKSLGKKRPREEDSGDDGDDKQKLDAVQVKKLKQMINEEADDSGSTELDIEGDSEQDSDEDDEEYGGEDDSDHDGDTEDEFPEKVVKVAGSRGNAQQQQTTSVKPNLGKSKNAAKQSEPKVGVQEKFRVSSSNILLFNIPRLSENDLHGFLAKRNVHPESVSCINSPVALLGFADDVTAKKAISACSGAAYNQATLAVVSITGGDIGMIRSNKNPHPGRPDAPLTCLFVTSLPKYVTEKEILKIVGIEPKHLRLITSGPKNHVFNACYVDCNSEDDAKRAFQALQNYRFGDTQVRVFLKPQSNFNPITDTSLVIANVPFDADVDDVKKQFPSAKKVELTRRGCFMLSFDSAEERARVLKESEGKVMGGRALRFITSDKSNADHSVFVSNIAFAVTADELRAAFPGCKSVFMKKKNDGRFNGNAIVCFATREAAEAAAKEGAKKELKGRVLKTKLQDGPPGPSADNKKQTDKPKSRVENKAKIELPTQVGSDSEGEEEEEEDEADEDEEEEEEDDDDKSDDEEVDEDDSEEDSVNDEEINMVDEGDASDSDAEGNVSASKRSKQEHIPAGKGHGRGGKREARGGRGGGFPHRGNRGGGRYQNRGNRGGRGRGGSFRK